MTAMPMNVLIVDDEIPLRQELRIFPWEDCGAVLIGEAGNGEEALHLCESCVPDVVVTDITMPIMDGITLIRELKRRYPAVQIILLTCHSDFHYVQEALRLGALEYLLKVSMDEEELKQALDKVRAAIVKERHSRDSEKAERRLLQAALFGKLLHGHELSRADWQHIGLDETRPHLLARFIIHAPNPVYLAARQRIQQILNEIERSEPDRMTWLSIREQEYFVLLASRDHTKADVEPVLKTAKTLADSMKEFMSGTGQEDTAAYAILSGPFKTKDELVSALALTTEWKEALFYDGVEPYAVFTGSPLSLLDMSDKHMKEMSELLRKAGLQAASLKECLQNDLYEWWSKRRIKPQQLKQRLVSWRVEWLKERGGTDQGSAGIGQLMEARTLKEMTASLLRDIESIESGSKRSRIEIRVAIKWIKDNMQHPISLPILAEQVGLSPQYISRLFREETGSSVNEYITRLRMERAIELLKRTNKKVYEIAEEVGIPSYRYFTVTFRNWTGVSPTDFKRHI
ncbi:response regulator [Paenibacillus harenae]|uniref:response regulator n=1 Tax=Paenibacillus harenae TaxID=306543 RepID=UPI00042667B0|nr:response regulator [Paenibacillus harenae]